VRIFLSHSTRDAEIAGALKALLDAVFGNGVKVTYSSDQAPGAGVRAGARWRAWIKEEIRAADQTHVLLTPNSLGRPWVLWESGVAAGVAIGNLDDRAVLPVMFGLSEDDVPQPLRDKHAVKGDTDDPNGVHRLLQCVNEDLVKSQPDAALSDDALEGKTHEYAQRYLDEIEQALQAAAPVEALLAKVPPSFPAEVLGGFWATSYEFASRGRPLYHADIVKVTAESKRRIVADNRQPTPRTEGRQNPFLNNIDAQLVNRHLIGHWRNTGDTRYFGGIHLAVCAEENVMDGFYTSFDTDVETGALPWRWVRIDPHTIDAANLPGLRLRDPRALHKMLRDHDTHAGPINLNDLLEDL